MTEFGLYLFMVIGAVGGWWLGGFWGAFWGVVVALVAVQMIDSASAD